MNIELTLLSEKELVKKGSKPPLKVFNLIKEGPKAEFTDLAILSGCDCEFFNDVPYGEYYTSTTKGDDVITIADNGNSSVSFSKKRRQTAIRPAFKSDEVYNMFGQNRKYFQKIVPAIEFGFYPQTAAPVELQKILDKNANDLTLTGNTYTLDGTGLNEFNNGISPVTYSEYSYNGRRFIHYIPKSEKGVRATNDQHYSKFDSVWVEVEPVTWLYDEQSKTFVAEKCLAGGIRYSKTDGKAPKFEKSEIYKFMNEYMIKDMVQDYEKELVDDSTHDNKPEKQEKVFDNVLGLDSKNVSKVYVQISERNQIDRIFVEYEPGNLEMRNKSDDSYDIFRNKVTGFLNTANIKPGSEQIVVFDGSENYNDLRLNLLKETYLKQFSNALNGINNNIDKLNRERETNIGISNDKELLETINQLTLVAKALSTLVEKVVNADLDFLENLGSDTIEELVTKEINNSSENQEYIFETESMESHK